MATFWRQEGKDIILRLHVQPRASRDEFAGPHGDALKLRITAPPSDGKANRHLLDFIAATFGVARRDVTLLAGASSRRKTIRINQPSRLPPEITRA